MTASQKGRIFISYRRADSAGYAGRIYDRLAAHFGDASVFMDVDTIEAGVDFVEVLENAVQSCDVLVALMGRQWLNIKDEAGKRRLDNPQDFVRIEVAAALSRGIRVIPVLVDGTIMPDATQLPSNLESLARRNAVLVNHHSFHADANRLIKQLEVALKAAEESKILKAKELKEKETRKKRDAEIEKLLSQADIAFNLHDWEVAKEKLEAVLNLEPEHIQAQVKLAIIQRKLQEIKEQKFVEEKATRKAAEKAAKEKAEREIQKRTAQERDMAHAGEQLNDITHAHRQTIEQQSDLRGKSGITSQIKPSTVKTVVFSLLSLVVLSVLVFGSSSILKNIYSSGTKTPDPTTSTSAGSPQVETVAEVLDSAQPIPDRLEELEFNPISSPTTLAGDPPPFPTFPINVDNSTKVAPLARWGKGGILGAAYSPDGAEIALATSIGVFLLESNSLTEILFINASSYIRDVTYSLDGKKVIVLSNRGDILEFQENDGKFLRGYKGFFSYVRAFDFSPDKTLLALAGYAGSGTSTTQIYIINLKDGAVLQMPTSSTGTSSIEGLKFSPDGKYLADYTRSGIHFWEPLSGKLIRTIETRGGYKPILSFSNDSQRFAYIESDDSSILIYNLSDGTLLQSLEGHGVGIGSLSFSPDNQSVVYGIGEGAIRIRNIEDGNLVKTLQGHTDYVRFIIYSVDGNSILTTSDDTTVRLWNIGSGTISATLDGFTDDIKNISVSPDNDYLVSSGNSYQIWQIKSGMNILNEPNLDYWSKYALFLPDGQTLALNTRNDGVQLKQFMGGELTDFFQAYTYPNFLMAISPNGKLLAADTYDNEIELSSIDIETGYSSRIQTLKGHTDEISSLVFSPDSKLLASGASDNTVRLWNVEDGSVKYVLKDHLDQISGIAFSPDGKQLVTSSDDGTVIFWQTENGASIQTIEFPPKISPVRVAYSPDGKILATGTYIGDILLWQEDNGSLLQTLKGHTADITDLVFTSDGKLLISSANDGTIRLWGIAP